MSNIQVRVTDRNMRVLTEANGIDRVTLVHVEEYQEGDAVHMICDIPGFYEVRYEDTLPPTLVYVPGTEAQFIIPFGTMNRIGYSPRAFEGKMHLITAAIANPDFVFARRNLALNPFDAQGDTGMFPHASANAETRGEALFAARNAIDGMLANHAHYPYPFQSWGINQDPDAELKVEFGVAVNIDSIVLVLRADYPHDNYWTRATIEFSDGSHEVVTLEKTALPQSFAVEKEGIEWMVLKELIPSADPSPFPALTEIEAWGRISEK